MSAMVWLGSAGGSCLPIAVLVVHITFHYLLLYNSYPICAQEACQAVSTRVARALENVKDASSSFSASLAEVAQSAAGCDAAAEEVVKGAIAPSLYLHINDLQDHVASPLAAWGSLIVVVTFAGAC